MLFASTQVNAPQQTGLASLSGLAETVTQQAQLGNSAGPESAEGTSVSTDATKKKRFKLSIFLLRR